MVLLKRGQARAQWLIAAGTSRNLEQGNQHSSQDQTSLPAMSGVLPGCGLISHLAVAVQSAPDNSQRLDKCQVHSVGHRSLLGIH